MIQLTNQDSGKIMLINKKKIITVEDVGFYRVVTYTVSNNSHYKMYASESVEEIKKKIEEEGDSNG